MNIKSMTGYGRGEADYEGMKAVIEMKSVNHRYLDMSIRMPRRLNYLDVRIRNVIKKRVSRGKMDIFVSFEDFADKANSLVYNKELAKAYLNYFSEMQNEFSINNDISTITLARLPDVMTIEDSDADDERIWSVISNALENALSAFDESRTIEGNALVSDLVDKLDEMSDNVKLVQERYPLILSGYEARLREKLSEFIEAGTIDESRIAAELVIFADKLCTDEETVRLNAHIAAAKKLLTSGGEIGKQLDFIIQEMNREANTLLSKANDIRTSDIGIALKTGIEKIREQVQNIE